ncbi:MAG TPA: beta-N-acetylhexosaminidase [Acidobacteriaceae bacterium]|nr:beta-N-acetylhexosaminidase [Acidobacteriaceae bacterium]
MRRAAVTFLSVWVTTTCVWAAPNHSPLLPRPQNVQYGTGQIALRNLTIEFSASPNDEDRFAAGLLARAIETRTGVLIPITKDHAAKDAIVLDRTGIGSDLPLPEDVPGPSSREAYDVTITPTGVTIRALSSTGIFYGIETLTQMIEGQERAAMFPIATVHDWPSLAFRGTLVDISHGPLPTLHEIERQLDFLARWKGNQYYLYSEASIELAGFPLLNPRGRLSKSEVQQIIEYGRERHIDVILFCDLYGHMHDLFRIEKYSDLSDLPHGSEFDPRNPKVLPLLTDWAAQLSQLFPSPFVAIGFDETFQSEMTAGSGTHQENPNQLYLQQITAVTQLFQQHGKHVMAFSDIMSDRPEMIPHLPKGLIAIPWHFTAEDPEYKHQLAPLIANHIPYFVEPGLMSWAQVAPDYDTTFENIDTFLAAGRKSHALGLINSVWSDNGQILYRMCLPGMAYGAAAAWQSQLMNRADFFSEYAQIMYPESVAPDVASALENMNLSELSLQKVLGQQTMFAFWEDPFFPAYYKALAGHESDLRQTRLYAEDAETSLIDALSKKGDPETLASLLVVSRLLDYAGARFQTSLDLAGLWSRLGPKRPDTNRWWENWQSMVTYQSHSRLVDLMDAITELQPLYRKEWLMEYTQYRLDSTLGRFDHEYQYWRAIQEKLMEFSDSTKEGDSLPALDHLIEER